MRSSPKLFTHPFPLPDMYEVEVKVRAAHGPVKLRLREQGAEEIRAVRQFDTYYNAPHRDFAETDEALRIRESIPVEDLTGQVATTDRAVFLTYKGPLVEAASKTRVEAETTIGDETALADILESLGFHPAGEVRKDREIYRLDGYTVTLDAVNGLGEFVEVETEAEDGGIETARTGAMETLERLDLDPDSQIRTSYLRLLREKDE